jgi:hypothetical protein
MAVVALADLDRPTLRAHPARRLKSMAAEIATMCESRDIDACAGSVVRVRDRPVRTGPDQSGPSILGAESTLKAGAAAIFTTRQ